MSTTPQQPFPSAQPPAPPRPSNNAIWWVLGIVGGCIVLMIIAGLTFAGLFLRRVNIRNSGNTVDIQTPVGEIKVNQDELHATGLPVYPGAIKYSDENSRGGSADISFGGEGLGIAVENYISQDSLDKVRDWYRNRLGSTFRLETGKDQEAEFRRAKINVSSDQDLAFVDDHGDKVRVVALKKTDDGVKITLLRLGKREAQ